MKKIILWVFVVVVILVLAFISATLDKHATNQIVTNPIIEKLDSIQAQNDSILKELKDLNNYLYD